MAEYELDNESVSEDSLKDKKTNIVDEVFDWLESLVLSFFVVVLVFTFLFRIVNVEGSSMEPTLQNGDKLILTSMFYEPTAGDIVVVNVDGFSEKFIKRIIAVGGQKIDIDFENGIVKVDDEVLSEPYIKELTTTDEKGFSEYPVVVPEGFVFVMGDNRNASTDSRDGRVGFISEKDILGKVVLRVLPIDNMGKIYD